MHQQNIRPLSALTQLTSLGLAELVVEDFAINTIRQVFLFACLPCMLGGTMTPAVKMLSVLLMHYQRRWGSWHVILRQHFFVALLPSTSRKGHQLDLTYAGT